MFSIEPGAVQQYFDDGKTLLGNDMDPSVVSQMIHLETEMHLDRQLHDQTFRVVGAKEILETRLALAGNHFLPLE